MKASEIIRSNSKNIQFYAKKIQDSISNQYWEDCNINNSPEVIGAKTIRLNALTNMYDFAKQIESNLEYIEINLKICEKEGLKIIKLNEEGLKENGEQKSGQSGEQKQEATKG